jgi:hypothetical protein
MLSGPLHRFVETGDLCVGCYIRTNSFSLTYKRVEGLNGQLENLIFLVLEDLAIIGWNESYRDHWRDQEAAAEEQLAAEGDLDLEEARNEYNAAEVDALQAGIIPQESPRKTKEARGTGTRDSKNDDEDEDDDDDTEEAFAAFEAVPLPRKKPAQQPSLSKTSTTTASSSTKAQQPYPVALPRDWHDPQTPLKLTTLRSLPYLPYRQNWSCNILCIIASLSPVEPSHLPPYKQRVARIADPSTTKRVLLSVFLDPDDFTPQVGSAVLLVGVKNHHFDGGSLKKYASDKKFGRWWFEDPKEMTWCDVQGIKDWWAQAGNNDAP